MNRWTPVLLGTLILILAGTTLFDIFHPPPKRFVWLVYASSLLTIIVIQWWYYRKPNRIIKIEVFLFASELMIILLYAAYQLLT